MSINIIISILSVSLLLSCRAADNTIHTDKNQADKKSPGAKIQQLKEYGAKGCVSKNCMDGEGIFIWNDGTRYSDTFKHSKPHGKGMKTWAVRAKIQVFFSHIMRNYFCYSEYSTLQKIVSFSFLIKKDRTDSSILSFHAHPIGWFSNSDRWCFSGIWVVDGEGCLII